MKMFRSFIALLFTAAMVTGVSAQTKKRELLSFADFEAKLKSAGKNAQILDARLPEEYVQNHLEGAVSFSVADAADFEKQTAKLSKDKPTFIYSIGNGRSGVLAEQLREAGFRDVTEVPGGLSKWIGLGRPVISTTGKGLSLDEYQASLKSDKLVLVDFGSRYCPGCKKLDPVIDSIKTEQASQVKVIKIEAYENKSLVKELGVVGLPTLVLYKNNEIVWQKKGGATKAEIETALSSQAFQLVKK
ncbi:thioredoxin domain-containing protein [Dyadobacter sandarakinus]|uniref:Thioredoxin fold domain-containing protein n=1 Tax=Dyadobacter sandarakinus TaxID=2747268 RepID=A0ABX7I558_9BACT|nr:thioredoxin domain-containing protein [Dyadobacter sandarakinus]QRR00667.1 thioredoxin fold domain-containing protein [Dyadobacter sandarakinus]